MLADSLFGHTKCFKLKTNELQDKMMLEPPVFICLIISKL